MNEQKQGRRTVGISAVSLLAAALVFGLALQAAEAVTKTLRVCNRSGQTVYVVVGWTWYMANQSKGWFVVKDDDCADVSFPDADSVLPLYGYAKGKNGKEYLPSSTEERFCIHRAAAFEYGSVTCAAASTLSEEYGKSKNREPQVILTTLGVIPQRDLFDFKGVNYEWTIR